MASKCVPPPQPMKVAPPRRAGVQACPGLGQDLAQDPLDLVEVLLAADERRGELDDPVAAVVGPAHQAGVEQGKLRSVGWADALGLLLGGATGNLLDRIFRAPGLFAGHVVDWIELPHWPVFNLADSSICCAAVLVVLLALRGIRLDGTKGAQSGDDRR